MTAIVTVPSTEPRPGWTSTEFYVTLGTLALSFAAAVLAMFGHTLDPNVREVVATAAPLAGVVAGVVYTLSRGHVKAAGLIAAGQVAAQSMALAADQAKEQKAWDLAAAATLPAVAVPPVVPVVAALPEPAAPVVAAAPATPPPPA